MSQVWREQKRHIINVGILAGALVVFGLILPPPYIAEAQGPPGAGGGTMMGGPGMMGGGMMGGPGMGGMMGGPGMGMGGGMAAAPSAEPTTGMRPANEAPTLGELERLQWRMEVEGRWQELVRGPERGLLLRESALQGRADRDVPGASDAITRIALRGYYKDGLAKIASLAGEDLTDEFADNVLAIMAGGGTAGVVGTRGGASGPLGPMGGGMMAEGMGGPMMGSDGEMMGSGGMGGMMGPGMDGMMGPGMDGMMGPGMGGTMGPGMGGMMGGMMGGGAAAATSPGGINGLAMKVLERQRAELYREAAVKGRAALKSLPLDVQEQIQKAAAAGVRRKTRLTENDLRWESRVQEEAEDIAAAYVMGPMTASSLQRPYEWRPTLRALLRFLGSKPDVEEPEIGAMAAEAVGGMGMAMPGGPGGLELGAPGMPGGAE